MRAWLERITPEGPELRLPEGAGHLVFGRSPRCTVIFDGALVASRHCELAWDGAAWRLRDLGSAHGTFVNGQRLRASRALFDGDVIGLGPAQLRFRAAQPAEDPTWTEAIARAPDAEAPWLVYADRLLEVGDPLGERIMQARAGGRVDHLPWLGRLWDPFVAGALELGWSLGHVRQATVRTVAGRPALDWRDLVATLVNLRVGRFLRELVIDLPRLEGLATVGLPEGVRQAQHFLAALPSLPPTLTRLSLGYELSESAPATLAAAPELRARCPRLLDAPVYTRAAGAQLRLETAAEGVRVSGVDGARRLQGVTRLRRGPRQLFVESPPGMPLLTEGNPCYFTLATGRVQLTAGRLRGELTVNGRVDALYELLPGDVIDAQAGARFRLELVP